MVKYNQIPTEDSESRLESVLTGQEFEPEAGRELQLEAAKRRVLALVGLTGCIAVLSDLETDSCYIFSGSFGETLGLGAYSEDRNSAFEHGIFDNIPADELLERHVTDLRLFNFLKSVPLGEKTDFLAVSLIHFSRGGTSPIPVLHTTRYLACHRNGTMWLSLCTYHPFCEAGGLHEGVIINVRTGEAVRPEKYRQYDKNLLSGRQREVLALLAKGKSSKQIAESLCLSIHTVNRHRQDILAKLDVANTAAAVEIALHMHLLDA